MGNWGEKRVIHVFPTGEWNREGVYEGFFQGRMWWINERNGLSLFMYSL